MIGIYKITNILNGKSYIGQSVNIDRRIYDHFYRSQDENSNAYNAPLHIAIRKYGKENFQWEVLQECTIEEIDNLERYYIQKYNTLSPNGYNILEGGQKIRVASVHYCERCGIKPTYDKNSKFCRSCYYIESRKVERPTREELKNLIRTKSFVQIGKDYGVSDSAIRKWCKTYNLPFKKYIINRYNDEDWKKI